MPRTPLQTIGTKYSRDKLRVRRFDLIFFISGPDEGNPDEPYDLLDSFKVETPPLGLPEIERKADKKNDGWDLTLSFEGIPITEDIPDPGTVLQTGNGAEIELDHSGSEDPIETFPQFDLLAKKYKAQMIDGYKLDGWALKWKDPTSGQSILNPIFGTTHFLNDGAILRLSFSSRTFEQSWLKDICKIDLSLIPTNLQDSIQIPGTQSWLKRSIKGAWRGNVWVMSFEWLMGKWIPDVYLPPAS